MVPNLEAVGRFLRAISTTWQPLLSLSVQRYLAMFRPFTRKTTEENRPSAALDQKVTNDPSKRRAFGRDLTNANANVLPANASDNNNVFKNPLSMITSSVASVMASSMAPQSNTVDMDMGNDHMMSDPSRPYMDRPSDDIDSRDAENPLLCTEYVNEMYELFSKGEREFAVNPTYMSTQPNINEKMRTILVDWLVRFIRLLM